MALTRSLKPIVLNDLAAILDRHGIDHAGAVECLLPLGIAYAMEAGNAHGVSPQDVCAALLDSFHEMLTRAHRRALS